MEKLELKELLKENLDDNLIQKLKNKEISPESALKIFKDNVSKYEVKYYNNEWTKSDFDDKNLKVDPENRLFLFAGKDKKYNNLPENTVIIETGKGFVQKKENHFVLDPLNEEDYLMFAAKFVENDYHSSTIIYDWGSDLSEIEQKFISVLYLCKSIMLKKWDKNVLILYTFIDKNDILCAENDAFSGFLKTLGKENPSIKLKTVRMDSFDWKNVVYELSAKDLSENEIWYHCDKRYIKKIKEVDIKKRNGKTVFRNNAVYLIIGGLGGLGKLVSKYLLENFCVTLILTGRRNANSDKLVELESYNKNGSSIRYFKSDITDKKQVADLISAIKKEYSYINGVIHSAGVYKNGFIIKKSVNDVKEVLAPKINGTVYLDSELADEPLDFFLVFSSMASVTGKVGQCDYAYANSFLDYFCERRNNLRKDGLRYGKTVATCWPYWKEGGMQILKDEKDKFEEIAGIKPLPTKLGLEAIESILLSDLAQCAVFYGDKNKLKEYLSENIIPNNVVDKKTILMKKKQVSKNTSLENKKALLHDKTEDMLKDIISEEIGLPKDKLDSKVKFEEYGIDSIIINQFNTSIEQRIGEISKTLLFEYQTINDLTNYLVEKYTEKLNKYFELDNDYEIEENYASGDNLTEDRNTEVTDKNKDNYISSSGHDIAIIGISIRYPMANNVDEFWDNLYNERNCITKIPKSRWDMDEYFDPDEKMAKYGKIYCNYGGFIDRIYDFDPIFFHIPPTEAVTMDPQERLFLTETYKAIGDAGYTQKGLKDSARYANTDVGVFVGATTFSYSLLGQEQWEKGNYQIPASTGWGIANRISYTFDFNGPSIAFDTACSSGLVAVHEACEKLINRECGVAIVGGINLYLHPSKYIRMCQVKMLSKKGRCNSFGADADGFVPGEGVGVLILKPIERAIEDSDHIYGVIKGTAVNHGGRMHGFTVPNPNAQAAVIKEALKKSCITPDQISYIEAHGTGTELGDPIEITGLKKVFAFDNFNNNKCKVKIGSVKSNIGHLESCAGIASITKVLMQFKHRTIVKSLNCEVMNPNISFSGTPFELCDKQSEWLTNDIIENGEHTRDKMRAGISSFGAGGVNSHIIIEEYPYNEIKCDQISENLVLLSANDREELDKSINIMYKFLLSNKKCSLKKLRLNDVLKNEIENCYRIIDQDSIKHYEKAFEELQNYINILLADAFIGLGINDENCRFTDVNEIKLKLHITSQYDRLTNAFLKILEKAKLVYNSNEYIFNFSSISFDSEVRKERIANIRNDLKSKYSEVIPYIELIDTCVNSYTEILTGKVSYTDVMFPNGKMDLVEKIYKGNKIADYFNKAAAYSVKCWVKAFIEANPGEIVNILEVGAGTGGLSKFMLKELNEFRNNVHYCYTDLSFGFTQFGKKIFKEYDFVEYRLFDAEKPVEAQGFTKNSYNIVIASNVVHATKNIENTLGNIYDLLNNKGIIVLNESIQRLDYSTLTFGLTDGWWLFEDEENRIEFSPILSNEKWSNVLKKSSFSNQISIGLPGRKIEDSIQNIIISEKNGEDKIEINLPFDSLCYTLQTGREHMNCRAAFIANSTNSLKNILEEYLSGQKSSKMFFGIADKSSPLSNLIVEGTSGNQFQNLLFKEKDFKKIAQLWVNGTDFMFEKIWENEKPLRISLPTYNFKEENYCIKSSYGKKKATAIAPLLDVNKSDLNGLRFEKELSHLEFAKYHEAFRDNHLLNMMILFEMVYEAGDQLFKNKQFIITDVVWGSPVLITDDIILNICIYQIDDNIMFEINSSEKTIYMQGKYSTKYNDIKSEYLITEKTAEKKDVYNHLKSIGYICLNEKKYISSIEKVINQGDYVEKYHVRLNSEISMPEMVLNTNVLASIMHTVQFCANYNSHSSYIWIPDSVEKVVMFDSWDKATEIVIEQIENDSDYRVNIYIAKNTYVLGELINVNFRKLDF